MRTSIFSSALLLSLSGLMAQSDAEQFSCKNHDAAMLAEMFANDPDAWARMEAARIASDAHTQGFVRDRGNSHVIPVVFHIIHQNGQENISDAQIQDAIRVLNEDFNKLNTDWTTVRPVFLDRVADVGIEFRLAKRDPSGNCTNGITRTFSPLTTQGNYAMTQLIQWPRSSYMNVWVGLSANGAAGYTNYPWVLDGSPNSDGIVVKSDYIGSIGTSSPGRARVLSHEVGHWLNLKHCWGNSNDPGDLANCEMDDDVADTPLTKGWTSCSLNSGSCGSEIDNVENYMEYSYCDKMFTNGQADRMIAALTGPLAQRNNLWQPQNLDFTGVYEEPVLCEARFSSQQQQICAGQTVNFIDQSFNMVTERTWDFPGGDPATSTEVAPVVTYSEAGIYPVSLTVSDGISTLTTSQPVAVEVLSNPGAAVPVQEGFESTTTLSTSVWTVHNPDGDGTFMVTTNTGATGIRSVRLPNGFSNSGRIDELISGSYDLSELSTVELSFKYAFARRNSSNNDLLRVYVSNTCGRTWSLRKQLTGLSTLATASNVAGSFVPNSGQWQETFVTNIGAPYRVSNFRFKFEFISDGGNDLYLDDINLNGTIVGLGELTAASGSFVIRPNPTAGNAQAMIDVGTSAMLQLSVVDPMGRLVIPTWNVRAIPGMQTIDLPTQGLAEGLYFVRIAHPEGERVSRLMVEAGTH